MILTLSMIEKYVSIVLESKKVPFIQFNY